MTDETCSVGREKHGHEGPTGNFFHRRPDFKAWTKEGMQALPMESLQAKESEMLDTHVTLYHGQSLQHWANTHFHQHLYPDVYISRQNGVADSDNPDPLKTLLSMQIKNQRAMRNAPQLQVATSPDIDGPIDGFQAKSRR